MAANRKPRRAVGRRRGQGVCSSESPFHVANQTPQRQHNRDIADILSALADADRCLSLGLYRAARVHGLRAVRLIMAGAAS